MDALNLIQTIATVVGAFSIVLVWWQLKADHERSRREKSLDLMSSWNNSNPRAGSADGIISLIEELDNNQCLQLWRRTPFTIKKELKPIVESIAKSFKQDIAINEHDDGITLEKPLLSLIRADLAHYLNSLEIIATAWRHHAVDRDIIEEEFVAIFSKRHTRVPYEVFRQASGVYPSIDELCKAIEKKENMRTNKKRIA